MPDKNIKKNIILKKDLPSVIGSNQILNYEIRYRIISEDKNRLSHWSPINILEAQNTEDETGFDPTDPAGTSIPYQVSVDKSGHIAEIVWTMPSLLIVNPTDEEKKIQAEQSAIKEFDVYISWKVSGTWTDWTWGGVASGRKYFLSYSPSTTATDVKFRVQKVTLLKEPFDAATYLISSGDDL
jgi:hypothetical protein